MRLLGPVDDGDVFRGEMTPEVEQEFYRLARLARAADDDLKLLKAGVDKPVTIDGVITELRAVVEADRAANV